MTKYLPREFLPSPINDVPEAMTMAAFYGIAWYLTSEVIVRLFFTFKRRRGLYFWSVLLAAIGASVQSMASVGVALEVWHPSWLSAIFEFISWALMVHSQSVVQYSRLHLIVNNRRHIRLVLYMVIFTFVVICIPTMVMGYLSSTFMEDQLKDPYLQFDKAEMVIYFVQEVILSLLYIHHTRKHLKNNSLLVAHTRNEHNGIQRDVLNHLLWTNAFIILIDISLLAVSFAGLFYVQWAYKSAVYALKLRIEFSILNQLVASVRLKPNPKYTNNATDTYRQGGGMHSAWVRSNRTKKDDDVRLETLSTRSGEQMIVPISQDHQSDKSISEVGQYQGEGIRQTTEIEILPVSSKR